MKILIFITLLPIYAWSSLIGEDIRLSRKLLLSENEIPESYLESAHLVKNLFSSHIMASGAELIINYDMQSETVNAFASRENNSRWFITFKGGFISHPGVDDDIFISVLCHELGHHIGGAPYKFAVPHEKAWVSVEGQSDYFAANICMKKILQTKNNRDWYKPKDITPEMKLGCESKYSIDNDEYFLCLRSAYISQKLGFFITKLGQNRRGRRSKTPYLKTPSTTIRTTTMIQHPDPQCRLDTYFQGTLCDELYASSEGFRNCPDIWQKYSGARPRCWYAE